MTAPQYSLAAAIEGSRGTVVFGGGVFALTGEVVEAAADHIMLAVGDDAPPHGATLHMIPLTSIVYYRYSNDD